MPESRLRLEQQTNEIETRSMTKKEDSPTYHPNANECGFEDKSS
jgi:hypothetical protein